MCEKLYAILNFEFSSKKFKLSEVKFLSELILILPLYKLSSFFLPSNVFIICELNSKLEIFLKVFVLLSKLKEYFPFRIILDSTKLIVFKYL